MNVRSASEAPQLLLNHVIPCLTTQSPTQPLSMVSSVFSSRLSWETRPNALTRVLSSKRSLGVDVFDLTVSNPTVTGFIYPDSYSGFDLDATTYEPDPCGLSTARQAVVGYYSDKAVEVGIDQVFMTCSSSEAYAHLFRLLANSGDHVLVPQPSYPLFEYLAKLENVELRPYPLVYEDRWYVDIDALGSAVTDRTRAIIAVNPNNPTGSYICAKEWSAINKLCCRYNCAAIVDEVFADFAIAPPEDAMSTVAGSAEALTFVISGLSKVSALPQMKLGWIVVDGPAPHQAMARDGLILIGDTFLSVSTPVQQAVPGFLQGRHDMRRQIMTRLQENLAILDSALGSTAAQRLVVEGGWYAVIEMPDSQTDENWAIQLLTECDVLVQPGFLFDFASESSLVVSLLTPVDVMATGVRRLAALM